MADSKSTSTPRPRLTQFFKHGYGVVEIFAIMDRWDFLSDEDRRDLGLGPETATSLKCDH